MLLKKYDLKVPCSNCFIEHKTFLYFIGKHIFYNKKGNGGLSTFNLFTNQNFSHISLQAQWKVCGW